MQYLQRTGNVLGWKATGAGAGGCVIMLLQSEEYAPDVRKTCFEYGWTYLTWDYDHTGVVFECVPTKESVLDQHLEL
jgi:mevalonate kinase